MGAYDFGEYRFKLPRMGVKGAKLDDTVERKDPEYNDFRENRAVRTIQWELRFQGFEPGRVDGVFGLSTARAVRNFQRKHLGFGKHRADGAVGFFTAKGLFTHRMQMVGKAKDVPWRYLCGVVQQESGFDPVAVGGTTPADIGLVQVNTLVYPFKPAQCFDIEWALNWMADRLKHGYNAVHHRKNKNVSTWDLAIGFHHAPGWANQWANNEATPEVVAHMEDYVAKVHDHCGKTEREWRNLVDAPA